MKHAGKSALDSLDPLLASIRLNRALRERSRGVFYKLGKPYLHFHEDAAGLFADIAIDGVWERLPANVPSDWQKILQMIAS